MMAPVDIDAFLRSSGDDRILIVLNGLDRTQQFAVPIGDRPWRDCRLEDLIAGGIVKQSGGEAAIQVVAFGSRILRVK